MGDLYNVLVHGGRTIHTGHAPSEDDWLPDKRYWYGTATCTHPAFKLLREATVVDLDTRPRCRTCFPTEAQPTGTGEAVDG